MNIPVPQSRRGWFCAIILMILAFLVYYQWGYTGLAQRYQNAFWYPDAISQSQNNGEIDNDIRIHIKIPKYLSYFTPQELVLTVVNISEKEIKDDIDLLLLAGKVKKGCPDPEENALDILLCNTATSNRAECGKSSNVLHIDHLPPKGTVSFTVWVTVIPSRGDETQSSKKAQSLEDIPFGVRLVHSRDPENRCRQPNNFSTSTLDNLKVFFQSAIGALLLPPWTNGLIPVVTLVFVYLIENYLHLPTDGDEIREVWTYIDDGLKTLDSIAAELKTLSSLREEVIAVRETSGTHIQAMQDNLTRGIEQIRAALLTRQEGADVLKYPWSPLDILSHEDIFRWLVKNLAKTHAAIFTTWLRDNKFALRILSVMARQRQKDGAEASLSLRGGDVFSIVAKEEYLWNRQDGGEPSPLLTWIQLVQEDPEYHSYITALLEYLLKKKWPWVQKHIFDILLECPGPCAVDVLAAYIQEESSKGNTSNIPWTRIMQFLIENISNEKKLPKSIADVLYPPVTTEKPESFIWKWISQEEPPSAKETAKAYAWFIEILCVLPGEEIFGRLIENIHRGIEDISPENRSPGIRKFIERYNRLKSRGTAITQDVWCQADDTDNY